MRKEPLEPDSNAIRDDADSIIQPLHEVRFEYSPQLPAILEHSQISILITTYQAGKLLVLGSHLGKLSISFLDYEQPMGVAVRSDRIAVGSRRQIHFLVPAHETLGPPRSERIHDGCFVPRSSFYTGNVHGHDLAWGQDGLWIVNTLFSCLATLNHDYSFVPRWRPKFITRLIDQDRCHLNGLAIDKGVPRYVTAMAASDQPAGWRPTKATSGIVIDVVTDEIVSRDYSMPHSPRLHHGKLWLLNSGRGSFGYAELNSGRYVEVETVPGYARGLALHGQLAFVGLSKIRETSVFGGVPIAERREELQCGMGVVDLISGRTLAVFKFLSGVSEIFAVDVIPGFLNPLIAGVSVNRQEKEVWIVPAEKSLRPTPAPHWPLYSHHSLLHIEAPESPETYTQKFQQLRQQRNYDAAADALERAIALLPASAKARRASLMVDLGNMRQDQAKQTMAATCYQRATEIDPNCAAALQNLGYLRFNGGETEKAIDAYEQLLRQDARPINRLLNASVLPIIYDTVAEIPHWHTRQQRLLQQMVDDQACVDATQSLVPTSFLTAYQGLNDRTVMSLRGQVIRGRNFLIPRARGQRSDARPRIGFISAYFREHTIGKLNLPRFQHIDRKQLRITTILAAQDVDKVSQGFRDASDEFVLLPRSLPQAIQTLQQLQLDVLVFADVGMDALTSTLAFSRFAPLQAVTWGHPDTTGSPMIDYFLTSQLLETPDAPSHYTEKIWATSALNTLYDRPFRNEPHKTRDQLELPTRQKIYLCPQSLFKFHPEFDQGLHAIFQHDPNAYLVSLDGRNPEWKHRLLRRWRLLFPDKLDQIRFLPPLPREDFLDLLAAADVVLDPYHFGGGNSTFEAIAVGAPCVTYPGKFLRSRISQALYRVLGMETLIVNSVEDYAQLAVRIANDRDYRQSLRDALLGKAELLYEPEVMLADWNESLLALAEEALAR